MTHGHELSGGDAGAMGCAGWKGIKWGKWDNYNSIINNIYLKIIAILKMQCSEMKRTRSALLPTL